MAPPRRGNAAYGPACRPGAAGCRHPARPLGPGSTLAGAAARAVRWARSPADAIQRQLALGHHNLLVVGVSPRPGEALFFGQVAAELLDNAECSLLMVASEPFVASADRDSKTEELTTQVQRAA